MKSGTVSLFVVELLYKAPLDRIDAQMKPHMAFLKKHYAAGRFLISGRKIPRDGGIIIATGTDRAGVEAIMREDPFCAHGLADVRIVEFRASQHAEDLQHRLHCSSGGGASVTLEDPVLPRPAAAPTLPAALS